MLIYNHWKMIDLIVQLYCNGRWIKISMTELPNKRIADWYWATEKKIILHFISPFYSLMLVCRLLFWKKWSEALSVTLVTIHCQNLITWCIPVLSEWSCAETFCPQSKMNQKQTCLENFFEMMSWQKSPKLSRNRKLHVKSGFIAANLNSSKSCHTPCRARSLPPVHEKYVSRETGLCCKKCC